MTGFVAAIITVIMAAGSAATPHPGKVMLFKDWSVGCDNMLRCEAVSLPKDVQEPGQLQMTILRDGGRSGELKLLLTGFGTGPDRYRLVVDRKLVDTGAIIAGADKVEIAGPDAVKVAKALAAGNMLTMQDGAGIPMGKISLSGSSAALRYIDTAQGRAGSKGALAAVGRKAATARTPSTATLTVERIGANVDVPDAKSLVELSETSPCSAERFGPTADAAYSLGAKGGSARALILLNCGAGAYNFSSGAYVATRDGKGKWTYAPAAFDLVSLFTETGKVPVLVNAEWSPATQTLSAFSKGRGLGDCGTSEQYVWDGERFRLINATSMPECRGSTEWIQIWNIPVSYAG